MKVKQKLKNILRQSRSVLFFRILKEQLFETWLYTKFISNGNRFKDAAKLRTEVVVRTHALEKGMSIGHVKVGFGENKAILLLELLQRLFNIDNHEIQVAKSCSVLVKYIDFNKKMGADMNDIESKLQGFLTKNNIVLEDIVGGVVEKSHLQTIEDSRSSFDVFSQSRFSIRDFDSEKDINIDSLFLALKLCEKTPTACNRQNIRVYVCLNETDRKNLFRLQGGCNGFEQDMKCAILICADLRGYNLNELNLAYVDGGIYGMNLLYCLHYYGLASIPLTMGRTFCEVENIKSVISVPQYEIPVLMIGVGSYKDSYKVAVSERKDYKTYTKFYY